MKPGLQKRIEEAGLTVSEYFSQLAKRKPHHQFVEAGKLGFQAFVDKYFDGDRKLAGEWLAEKGHMVQDPFPENGAFKMPKKFEDIPF